MLRHRSLRLPLLRTLPSMRRSTVTAGAAPSAAVDVRDTRLVFAEVVVRWDAVVTLGINATR